LAGRFDNFKNSVPAMVGGCREAHSIMCYHKESSQTSRMLPLT